MKLTEKQQRFLEFLVEYIQQWGVSPTFDEICRRFGFRSYNTVTAYLSALEKKGYIMRPGKKNQKRSIEVILRPRHGGQVVPLLGKVAAGRPIEAIEVKESIEVPSSMLGSGEYFVLRVEGSSMIEDGIMDGDYIVVRRQPLAENGETVVALIDNQATLKRYYRFEDRVELRPANRDMPPIVISQGDIRIEGKVVGVIRYYR